jgi:chromosome segregation ATPase
MLASVVPWLHRRRWPNNERRIRDLINGANLNANYGYTYDHVPNRTRQRHWNEAQARVETTEHKVSQQREAIHNLRQQLVQLEQKHAQECRQWMERIVQQLADWHRRQLSGKPTKRCRNRLARLRQQREKATRRFLSRERTLWQRLVQHQALMAHLQCQLTQRKAARDAIDTETLCRERHLEKDQIMLDFQVLLGNLHDWVRQHYLAAQWKNLSLEKATQMIYRKSGRVTWHPDRIEVLLDAYAYRDQQQAMEATCQRFNEADLRWRDGRPLHINVADP